ncbi:Rso55p KNAG_0F03050 [Huiozyma naganishii CBS 8797]|uniref:Uncharacterized protein n=1 Tax=Huiozyma naganishii (strain ATCC MYA-139 / BCRC 22969 / CBS 8797 / KCTC 17520 / NBRC 10181 / NCYC 3082 / Yp74L-3) TaxID=1071383 RepID=J7S0F7_HUIN7|nr:hypothetical protein KNAG_0F03050 [Kazachstania naganishii CBS 8797]CCK70967.1 hypothetical protein KNAG_0F03050 [Kazachstania naganishii CBS 8797]
MFVLRRSFSRCVRLQIKRTQFPPRPKFTAEMESQCEESFLHGGRGPRWTGRSRTKVTKRRKVTTATRADRNCRFLPGDEVTGAEPRDSKTENGLSIECGRRCEEDRGRVGVGTAAEKG